MINFIRVQNLNIKFDIADIQMNYFMVNPEILVIIGLKLSKALEYHYFILKIFNLTSSLVLIVFI